MLAGESEAWKRVEGGEVGSMGRTEGDEEVEGVVSFGGGGGGCVSVMRYNPPFSATGWCVSGEIHNGFAHLWKLVVKQNDDEDEGGFITLAAGAASPAKILSFVLASFKSLLSLVQI